MWRPHIQRFVLSLSIGSQFHLILSLDSMLETKLIIVASIVGGVHNGHLSNNIKKEFHESLCISVGENSWFYHEIVGTFSITLERTSMIPYVFLWGESSPRDFIQHKNDDPPTMKICGLPLLTCYLNSLTKCSLHSKGKHIGPNHIFLTKRLIRP